MIIPRDVWDRLCTDDAELAAKLREQYTGGWMYAYETCVAVDGSLGDLLRFVRALDTYQAMDSGVAWAMDYDNVVEELAQDARVDVADDGSTIFYFPPVTVGDPR